MILPPPKSEDANPSQRNPASKIAQLETPVQPMHDLSTFVSSPSNKTSESTGLGAGPSRSYAAVKHQSKARKLNLKVKKGSKAAALHPSVDDLPPIHQFSSSFQMAEYLALLVARDPHDIQSLVELPSVSSARLSKGGEKPSSEDHGSSSSSSENRKHVRHRSGSTSNGGAGAPQSARQKETDLWVYEHLHRLAIDLTPLLVALAGACNRSTCPEMKAGEWQYLCVAPHPIPSSGSSAGVAASGHGHASHGSIAGLPSADGTSSDESSPETECCAIDYIMHTIDSHVALWNSSIVFPSRLSIKPGSERLFGQQARRLSRVFGHAYHRHRELFEQCEAETSLYARFLLLSQEYGLISKELLVIPLEATSGNSVSKDSRSSSDGQDDRKEEHSADATGDSEPDQTEDDEDDGAAFSRTQSHTAVKARPTKDVRPSAKAGRSLFPVEVTEEGEDVEEDTASASEARAESISEREQAEAEPMPSSRAVEESATDRSGARDDDASAAPQSTVVRNEDEKADDAPEQTDNDS